jgi:hypothetical protein
MPTPNDFPARGKIIEVNGDRIIFSPSNTTYQFHLLKSGGVAVEASDRPIEILIRVNARKVYTVPSGGNFIQPIFGPPKIIQGRVKFADDRMIVIHAAVPIICELPADDLAINLDEGRIQVGRMANVVAMPGATFQLATVAATVG